MTQVVDLNLSDKPTWRSLLHYDDRLKIVDPKFTLSLSDFSLYNELEATLKSFYDPLFSQQNLCKFPARLTWLKQHIPLPELSLNHCHEFIQFKRKVPVDTISLVYSSENLTQPSSMMGHILLKLSGITDQGNARSHGVSYFTELNSINVPKIVFDSMVAGKKGFFSLSPYQEKLKFYLKEEQRNVWEYELALNDIQRTIIQHHIWELKQADLNYFFQDYNCATLTKFIISLGVPQLLNEKSLWVTPIDVVKSVHREKAISRTSVIPSSKWNIRMLSEILDEDRMMTIKHAIDQGDVSSFDNIETPELKYLSFELADNYLDYLYESNDISLQQWQKISEEMERERSPEQDEITIDVSAFKSPIKTPQDTQFYIGATHLNGQSYMKVGFLPASHYLEDDNRQFFGENELRLSDIAILYDPENGRLKLDEFQLYSVSSLVPRNSLTGGVSARLRIGAEGHYDKALRRATAFNAEGGVGLTYSILTDINVFSMLGGGYGYARGESYFYLKPEIGLVIEEIYDMKSIISFENNWNQLNSRDDYFTLNVTQSKYINQNNTIIFKYHKRFNKDKDQEQLELMYKYHF